MWKAMLSAAGALAFAACTPNELGNVSATAIGDLGLGPAAHARFDAELTAACGDGGVVDAGVATIQRAPYLQQVSDRGAKVMWTAAGDQSAEVSYWLPGNEPRVAPARVDATTALRGAQQWIATFDDLEPYTIYCYELRGPDGPWVAPTGFRTAPEPGSDQPVSFVAIGDLGQDTSDQHMVAYEVSDVAHDFALLTGDIAYDSGSLSSFERYFFDVYQPYLDNVPVFPADGNHDFRTGHAGPYREVFALPENGGPDGHEFWYSFDYGSVHVAVLDTEQVGDVQAAWLDRDLAETTQPWKVVIGHRPPYSSGYHGSNKSVRSTFGPIFERRGVQLTLWGHDHDYERTVPINGVTYVVTGGGGVGTRPVGASSFTAFSNEVSHLVYVTVEGDQLGLWAVDATGQTFDTALIER